MRQSTTIRYWMLYGMILSVPSIPAPSEQDNHGHRALRKSLVDDWNLAPEPDAPDKVPVTTRIPAPCSDPFGNVPAMDTSSPPPTRRGRSRPPIPGTHTVHGKSFHMETLRGRTKSPPQPQPAPPPSPNGSGDSHLPSTQLEYARLLEKFLRKAQDQILLEPNVYDTARAQIRGHRANCQTLSGRPEEVERIWRPGKKPIISGSTSKEPENSPAASERQRIVDH
ncbi:hypothetical protein EX30DRAFT_390338 [Ascodesmis nigricans]|uniref:Uncharacterized protein n=1 Tax=Ascodesmis nigricans TaxID=341454 RepID=A0A4S2MY31_9PEZI|nr:hypothetical protein EX30DRAFT_390338 [Ascodesmis nigricans]